jgi:hypothetical protein
LKTRPAARFFVLLSGTSKRLLESGDTSLISWNPAVSVLGSPYANYARSFSQCGPNVLDQPLDGPFSSRAANLSLPLNPLLEEIPSNSLHAPTNFDL